MKKNSKKKLHIGGYERFLIPFSSRSGLSLLIAIGLSSLIMVFAVGVSKILISQLRGTSNTQESTTAYYAGESGLELAMLELKGKDVGYNIPKRSFDVEVGNRTAKIDFAVESNTLQLDDINTYTGKVDKDVYPVPPPWIGNASDGVTSCNQDLPPFPEDVNGVKLVGNAKVSEAALEHPCNWNRIQLGQTVTVPLYRMKSDNSGPINPVDNGGIGLFVFRVRTPCSEYGKLKSGGVDYFNCVKRPDLWVDETNKVSIVNTDNTVLNWEISSLNSKNEVHTIIAFDERQKSDEPLRIQANNSEIYERKINFAVNPAHTNNAYTLPRLSSSYLHKYSILKDNTSYSCSSVDDDFDDTSKCGSIDVNKFAGSIMEFLTNKPQQNPKPTSPLSNNDWNHPDNIKTSPKFKFTAIHPFYEFINNKKVVIPYLEYQIITDKAIASNLQTLTINSSVNNFKQSLQIKRPVSSSVLEFAVHN